MKDYCLDVLGCIGYLMAIFVVAGIVSYIIFLIVQNNVEYNDSDALNERSGFTVMTDYKTGLQYLKSGNALTPRLDRDGKQIIKDNK